MSKNIIEVIEALRSLIDWNGDDYDSLYGFTFQEVTEDDDSLVLEWPDGDKVKITVSVPDK